MVNAALWVAIGYATGRPLLAVLAFAASTLVLSVNFNLRRLYRARTEAMPEGGGAARRFYELVYAPQDRSADRLVRRRPSASRPCGSSTTSVSPRSTRRSPSASSSSPSTPDAGRSRLHVGHRDRLALDRPCVRAPTRHHRRGLGSLPGRRRRDPHGVGAAARHAGHEETPERFLRALYDATAGYEGDPSS